MSSSLDTDGLWRVALSLFKELIRGNRAMKQQISDLNAALDRAEAGGATLAARITALEAEKAETTQDTADLQAAVDRATTLAAKLEAPAA